MLISQRLMPDILDAYVFNLFQLEHDVFQDDAVFEGLKDWVLTISMDNSINFSSDMNIANNATSSDSGKIFEACPTDKDKICCVTGYPVKKGNAEIRSVGEFSFSFNNTDRGLLQTAKVGSQF